MNRAVHTGTMTPAQLHIREKAPVVAGRERKILLVSTNLGANGGAEEQVAQLALALHKRDWKVEIVSMLPIGEVSSEFLASGIPIRSLEMRRGLPDPRGVLRLKSIVDRFQPDVVHSHMTHANLLSRVVRLFSKIPVLICTLHGLQMNRVRGGSTRLREFGHRVTDRWADLTTTVCQAAAELCTQNGSVPEGKVLTLPNGVNTKAYRPDGGTRTQVRRSLGVGNQFMWLAVGRLELPKDYATMLDAFAKMRAQGDRSILMICGRGSLEAEIRQRVASLGLEKVVHLLGFRKDIPDLMAAADGYAMSSQTEGLPLVLLQASAAGLPIVATRAGGNPEVVAHGETGYLVGIRDAEALSAAMLHLVALPPDERVAMGLAGRARTKLHYSEERIVGRWEELYGKLLAGKRALHA